MTMKQLSVYVENKPGTLAEITGILGENGIDMCALSVADTERYGILRLIVNNPQKAEDALKAAGFTGIRVYADRRFSPPEQGAQRIYFSARKGKRK